jgi:hypothetical protein
MGIGQVNSIERAASYEVMRTTVLSAYISHSNNFSKDYAFAWYHRLAPLGGRGRDDAFDSGHEYPWRVMQEVLQLIQTLASKKEWDRLAFDVISKQLGGIKDPIVVIKYLTLSGKLDAETVEALRIGMPDGTDLWSFSPRDVRFPS